MNEAIAMSQQRPVECQGGAAVTICKPELDGIWIGYDDRRSKITSRSCQDSVQSRLKKHVSYFIVIIKDLTKYLQGAFCEERRSF